MAGERGPAWDPWLRQASWPIRDGTRVLSYGRWPTSCPDPPSLRRCARLSPVHLLFLDETGKPSATSFAVGGAAVRADDWPALREAWNAALESHGWPHDKEVKWHGTRS